MGLEKAIESGKEKRKPYYGAKACACSCRNNGSCSWCAGARQYKNTKRLKNAEQKLKEENEKSFDYTKWQSDLYDDMSVDELFNVAANLKETYSD